MVRGTECQVCRYLACIPPTRACVVSDRDRQVVASLHYIVCLG